jgi:prevent-host-death family protein
VERYLNVTEARRQLLEIVEGLHGADRVVITKRGQPRAVIVDAERYALLEDVAWVMQDPARRAALHAARAELDRGELARPPRGARPTPATLRRLTRHPARPRRAQ